MLVTFKPNVKTGLGNDIYRNILSQSESALDQLNIRIDLLLR